MKSYSVIWPRQNESLSLSLSLTDWPAANSVPEISFCGGRYTFLCDAVKEEWMDGWMDGRCLFFPDLGVMRACVRA